MEEKNQLTNFFLLLNADAIFDVDFNRMVNYHQRHNAFVTLFTHPNFHPYDSGVIFVNEKGEVERWLMTVRLTFTKAS